LKKIIFVILIAIFFPRCFPSLRIIDSEYEILKLTQEKAESKERDFSVLVPTGWFQTQDINYDGNEVWLVSENYTAVITLRKINSLSLINSKDKNEKLLSLARTSLVLHRRKNESLFKINLPPKLYKNGNLIYSSFEYGFGDNQIARIVITQIGGDYFECVAYTASKGMGRISLIELYSIQESVVASLTKNRKI
jgi:hypothetical protein